MPIDFAGSATATDGTNYPGITFHAQSGTVNTYSLHAFFVANEIYGASSPGKPFVSNVYNRSANDYLNGLNVQGTLSAGQPLPGGFGNGIKVSNHSYVADSGNSTTDENAIRRIDYTVNSEDVVLVAIAPPESAFANHDILWSGGNALSVRGDSAASPFLIFSNPSPLVNGEPISGPTVKQATRRAGCRAMRPG